MNKVCNDNRYEWDLKIPTVLWAYRTTCKQLTDQTPFKLVYGKEVVMPMEYTIPNLCFVIATGMDDAEVLEEQIA